MDYSDTAAELVSRVLHPFIVSVPLGAYFLLNLGLSIAQVARWTAIATIVILLPIAAYMYLKDGYSLRYPNGREERDRLYVIGMAELLVFGTLVYLSELPGDAHAAFLGAAATVAAGSVVNEYTKISVHTGTMSGFSTAFYFYSPATAAALALGTVAVGWSRLHLGRHNPKQVVLAALIPVLTVGLPLAVF